MSAHNTVFVSSGTADQPHQSIFQTNTSADGVADYRAAPDLSNSYGYLGNIREVNRVLGDSCKAMEFYKQSLTPSCKFDNRSAGNIHRGDSSAPSTALGTSRRIIEYFEQSLTTSRNGGDCRGFDIDNSITPKPWGMLFDSHKSIEYYKRALALSRKISDRRGEVVDLDNIGRAYADLLGDSHKAIEYFKEALTISSDFDPRMEGVILGDLGRAYYTLGASHDAIKYYERALAISRDVGDKRNEGVILGSLGRAYSALGLSRKAIEWFDQAFTASHAIGDRLGEVAHLGNLGRAYGVFGDLRRAIEYYEQALALRHALAGMRFVPKLDHRRKARGAPASRGDTGASLGHRTDTKPANSVLSLFSSTGKLKPTTSDTPSRSPTSTHVSPSPPATSASAAFNAAVATGTWRPITLADLPFIFGFRVRLQAQHEIEGVVDGPADDFLRLRIRGDEWYEVATLDVYDTGGLPPPPLQVPPGDSNTPVEVEGVDGPLGYITQAVRGLFDLEDDDGPLVRIVDAFRVPLGLGPPAPPAEPPVEVFADTTATDDSMQLAAVSSRTPTPTPTPMAASPLELASDPVEVARLWRPVTHADLPSIIGRRVRRRDQPAVEGVVIERDNEGLFSLHVRGHGWHQVAELDLYDTEGAMVQMPPVPDAGVRAPAEAGGLDGPLA